MTRSSALDTRNSLILVGGKGGVGKTTVAASLGVARADRGEQVVILSVDPAHSLGDALGVGLGPEPMPVPGVRGLTALELDAELERARFLASHRGGLLALLERGTYLDRADAEGLVDLTLPGIDELAALFRLRQLHQTDSLLIVDTAPTGHTLRLLDLPVLAGAWLDALRAMEDHSHAVRTALVGSYQPDEVTALLDLMAAELSDLSALLRDPERTAFVLVTTPEPVVLAETRRYREELAHRGIPVAAVVVNRAIADRPGPAPGVPTAFVPSLGSAPTGTDGLRSFATFLLEDGSPVQPPDASMPGRIRGHGHYNPPLDRWLYLVAGKGGVGKSTSAAALALRLREERRSVLLLGVDPAGSLGDVLGTPVEAGAGEVVVEGGLVVSQLDAASAWSTFRGSYRAEAERILSALLSTAGPTADSSLVERVVNLAPPGLDELAGLVEVVDASEDRPYDAIVVDTAPTGHFIRLLELPDVALEWTHQAMRLLLKYREVVAPGELGGHLLELARSLRRFRGLLRDPARSWVLVVTRPDELSLAESRRLLDRLDALWIPAGALLINRFAPDDVVAAAESDTAAELVRLAQSRGLRAFAAPALQAGPVGVEALSAVSRTWVEVRENGQEIGG